MYIHTHKYKYKHITHIYTVYIYIYIYIYTCIYIYIMMDTSERAETASDMFSSRFRSVRVAVRISRSLVDENCARRTRSRGFAPRQTSATCAPVRTEERSQVWGVGRSAWGRGREERGPARASETAMIPFRTAHTVVIVGARRTPPTATDRRPAARARGVARDVAREVPFQPIQRRHRMDSFDTNPTINRRTNEINPQGSNRAPSFKPNSKLPIHKKQ